MLTTSFSLLALALPALSAHSSPRSHRSFAIRARSSDPADLSKGSLTTAEGCTKFRHVAVGEFCIQVASAEGISLSDFYAMNPQIDSTCMNLWANSDYCVARTTSSPASAPSSTKAPAAALAAVTTKSLAPIKAAVTTSSAPTPTASASASATDDGEDEECDAEDDGDEDDSTSSETAPSTTKAAAPTAVVAAAQTTTAAATTTAASKSLLSAAGVTSFLGLNTGIGSWFHANLASDSTNGNSWCGFPYSDSSPGFAPSVGTMLKNFGGDYEKAATAYCGLEAIVTAPDGTTSTGVILDGFDDAWVRTPGSIDLMYNFFTTLNGGKSTTDKNNVIQGITWELTGTRNEQYKFKGVGSGGN